MQPKALRNIGGSGTIPSKRIFFVGVMFCERMSVEQLVMTEKFCFCGVRSLTKVPLP